MIDPKELRIGNVVERITVKAWSGTRKDIYTIRTGMDIFQCADLNPIPITPEWLERLGFAVGKRSIYKDFGFFEVEYERDQLYIGINEYQDSLYHIQYVHQLHNLVYALTGQELIIKQ